LTAIIPLAGRAHGSTEERVHQDIAHLTENPDRIDGWLAD
jgi:hypothetical protein